MEDERLLNEMQFFQSAECLVKCLTGTYEGEPGGFFKVGEPILALAAATHRYATQVNISSNP